MFHTFIWFCLHSTTSLKNIIKIWSQEILLLFFLKKYKLLWILKKFLKHFHSSFVGRLLRVCRQQTKLLSFVRGQVVYIFFLDLFIGGKRGSGNYQKRTGRSFQRIASCRQEKGEAILHDVSNMMAKQSLYFQKEKYSNKQCSVNLISIYICTYMYMYINIFNCLCLW